MKNGKVNEMPCHHKLESYIHAYIEAADIEGDRKGPLFRAAIGKTKKLGPGVISRTDVWYMVRRRTADAGIETAIGCHTFRATGITDYLTNGGRIEVAQRMAGHSNAKTTSPHFSPRFKKGGRSREKLPRSLFGKERAPVRTVVRKAVAFSRVLARAFSDCERTSTSADGIALTSLVAGGAQMRSG